MKLYVCISLDVEEEGLFCGQYRSRNVGVRNVARLARLAPLWHELGFPLTLYCAYAVFANTAASETVLAMRDDCHAEIGAHLHHWSTPPYDENDSIQTMRGENGEPERTHNLPGPLLRQRLQNLLAAGGRVNGAPLVSFRMGRWDLKNILLPLLAQNGIRIDSSVCPLRRFRNGADHFLAPADPYIVPTPYGDIVEAPVTQIPLASWMPGLWRRIARPNMLDAFHFFGALSANPFWHSPWAMRLCARLHKWRGGHALNLFWHSSEMLPGASPHMPSEAKAVAFLKAIGSYCRWLRQNFDVKAVTASQLAALPWPKRGASAEGDF